MTTVVVMDEDVAILERLAATLRQAGYEVRTASTGVAVKVADDGSADLVASGIQWCAPGVAAAASARPDFVMALPIPRPAARAMPVSVSAAPVTSPPSAPPAAEPGRAEPFECHAARRWAHAIIGLLEAQSDPRTLNHWGRIVGAAPGTLRGWCRMAGISSKNSLVLARLLRAVTQAQSRGWNPEQLLDVVDPRTLARMLSAGGLAHAAQGATIHELLARQSLVADRAAVDTLRRLLSERGLPVAQ
jgi:hypothetical protein